LTNFGVVVAVRQPSFATQAQKQLTKAGDITGTSHFMRTFNGSNWAIQNRGQTMSEPFEFAKYYKRPEFERPLRPARVAEREDDQMPTENLSELLGRVSNNSTSQIDDLVGDFGRLKERLRTDGERIQREIEEYKALSDQVMQMTKTISESVEKVRASADRPQGGRPQETE
jgi:vacuolar-type H+-ATPase subunit I/STV1